MPVADAEDAGVWRGDGSVDWLTSAINHPAGNIAECWLKALRRRIALAGDAWDGLPQEVRLRFERLLMGPGNSAVMGRIIFASQTQFLFAADRRWTEENIIPLFDWTADATRAAQAWEGFLWHPRWNDPLFERMQEFVRQTFTRLDELDEQDVFVSALASVAAFSNGDPWHHHAWLFEFMRVAAANHRAQWAQEFGRYIESLTADGTDILWTRWLAQYWDDRLTGVPVSLAEEERQVIITWVPALRSKLALLVTRITARPPTTLSHLTFHRLHQAGIATTSGREFGRLLRELFPHLQRIEYDFGEVAQLANEAADHGADPADLLVVAAHMARLQCSGAAALRDRLNG